MNKKILIVATVPETFESILAGQPKRLSKVFNISLASSPSLNIVRENEEVVCFDVPMHRGISPFRDLISIFKLIIVIVNLKPVIVHSYTPKAGLVAMIASFICRVPIRIHTFTGLIFPTSVGFKKVILRLFDSLICALATNIIPEGAGVKYDLLSNDITHKPLFILGHGNVAGVNTQYFCKHDVEIEASALRRYFNITNDAFVFCFVGRLTLEKGISELLEAFEQLSNDVHLIFVGAQDGRLPLPSALFQKLKNHDRIHLTGFLDDIRPALAASNILVLPSYREGFPNAPLQAGSMELPCIVTDINGCNEIISEGVNGWLVKPMCVKSLLVAMSNAVNSSDIFDMGVKARELIKLKFERDEYLKVLENFYNDTISEAAIDND